MVKKIIFSAAALIIILCAVCFIFFGETEEEKIRRTLTELCIDAAKSKEASSAAALLLKTNILKSYFTDPCKLTLHHGYLHGSYSDVRAANEIMRINLFFTETELTFSDIFITVEGETASAIFTGRFRATFKDGEKIDEVREVELELQKVEKKWRISSAEVHKILEKR